jgi:hypothetical protein
MKSLWHHNKLISSVSFAIWQSHAMLACFKNAKYFFHSLKPTSLARSLPDSKQGFRKVCQIKMLKSVKMRKGGERIEMASFWTDMCNQLFPHLRVSHFRIPPPPPPPQFSAPHVTKLFWGLILRFGIISCTIDFFKHFQRGLTFPWKSGAHQSKAVHSQSISPPHPESLNRIGNAWKSQPCLLIMSERKLCCEKVLQHRSPFSVSCDTWPTKKFHIWVNFRSELSK